MRLKIALRNLYISQLIIFIFLTFAYFTWFPYSLSNLGGFYKTAFMLIFADLVLGPLLVFIVFKEGKKYLKFDINVLLGIQIAAFVFGAYSLFLKHPTYAVFSHDQFTITNVSQVYPRQSFLDGLKTSFFSSPKFVTAELPADPEEQGDLMLEIILSQMPDIDKRPRLYSAISQDFDKIIAKSIPADQLFSAKKAQTKLAVFIKDNGGSVDNYAFFPLRGNNKKTMIWAFDRKTFKPIGIIDSNPWVLKTAKK